MKRGTVEYSHLYNRGKGYATLHTRSCVTGAWRLVLRGFGIAARAAARLRLSRAQYVGMPRAQVEALMEAARRPAPDADPAGVQHGAGVQRMDEAAGAYLMEVPGVRGG